MMLFPDALLNSPLFGIGLTVILYAISEIIIDRFSLNIIPPFVIACPLVIAVIVLAPGVEYKQYEAGAEFINFLLGPATIALALPLYKNRELIMAKAGAIAGGVTLATLSAIIVVYFCGKAMGTSEQVLLSLIPKSITTPIAIDVSKTIGGIPALTTAAVIFTGMLGATFNHKLLRLLGIKPFGCRSCYRRLQPRPRHQRLRQCQPRSAGYRRCSDCPYRHQHLYPGTDFTADFKKHLVSR